VDAGLLVHEVMDKNKLVRSLWLTMHIKRGKVSVRTSVMVGVASSVANDVTMRMTSQ